jgi:hypothetical protein
MSVRTAVVTISATFLAMACGGCGRQSSPSLTAEAARQAVLELIEDQPETFIGSPDPERLGQVALLDRGDGEFSFGAFRIHTEEKWYAADVGDEEVYSYGGAFVHRDGKWIATPPELARGHQLRE